MVHCGYEATAANAAISNPLKALRVALRGVRTEGPMAPEIPLEQQRPAEYVFSRQVQMRLSEIRKAEAEAKVREGRDSGVSRRTRAPASSPARDQRRRAAAARAASPASTAGTIDPAVRLERLRRQRRQARARPDR